MDLFTASQGPTPIRSQGDAAFDAWLRESLRSNYADLDREALPDCLLRLCDAPPAPG